LCTNKVVPWTGDISKPEIINSWESLGVSIRIPDGADFINANDSHFTSAFVFHHESKTLHDDDTIMVFQNPGFILRLIGARDGKIAFHPTTFSNGLESAPEAPLQFMAWFEKLLQDWDFDNIVAAHTGVKIGGAKAVLTETFNSIKPKLEDFAKKSPAERKKLAGKKREDPFCG